MTTVSEQSDAKFSDGTPAVVQPAPLIDMQKDDIVEIATTLDASEESTRILFCGWCCCKSTREEGPKARTMTDDDKDEVRRKAAEDRLA
jgi:adenylyl- and sulfurtransferase ThiI